MARKLDTDNIVLFYEKGIHVPSRTLSLTGEITRDSVDQTIRGLVLLNSISTDSPVRILLNSEGGDVNQGLALMDVIRSLKAQVIIDVVGEASSMAAIILQSGDIRRMARSARLMIHVGSEELGGHVHNVRRWAKYQAKEDKICSDKLFHRIREKHPKFTRGRLNRMLDFDTILSAEETIELGLADEIIPSIDYIS
jgi:ATP-dependent Clp protease, protease subunit